MKAMLATVAVLFLSGCDGIGGYLQLRDAKEAIASSLLDPSSAEFRGVEHARYGAASYIACGEVNGSNPYGGKAGFRPFMYVAPLHRVASDADSGRAIRSCCRAVMKSGRLPGVESTEDVPECAGVEPMPI